MKPTNRLGLPAFFLVLAFTGCSGAGRTGSADRASAGGPVVAMVGDEPVTLAEFERQYLRTKSDSADAAADSLGAYREFLDRYVDFRLKVKEAVLAGYGDRPELLAELHQYKGQLARPYLMEREVVEPMVRALYERRKEMVDASHILLRLPEDAPPGDTLRVWRELNAIADSIRAGADFEEMAVRHSEDPSARYPSGPGARGHLGYFSAGRMVEPFEDAMYATPVGAISGVFRTQFGYHVIRVNDRKQTANELRISHIMIQPVSQAPNDTLKAFERVQAALNRLEIGTPFEDVARDLSEDAQSSGRGGDLDWITYDGWLPIEMRDAAWAADSVGAVIGPVRTRFGWHIMKITGRRGQPSYEDSYEDLQQQVARMPRSQTAERAYARRLMRERGTTVDSSLVSLLIGTRSSDSLLTVITNGDLPDDLRNRTFITLGDSSYTLGQFGHYTATARIDGRTDNDRLWKSVQSFLEDRSIAYEIEALEGRDAQFATTMREFKDGLMLFRMMEDSVWTAATEDSVGLKAWYDAHAAQYRFGDRTRVVGIYAVSDSLLRSVADRLGAGEPLADLAASLAADTTITVRIDTTMVEGPSDSVFDRALGLDAGQSTGVLSYSGGRVVLVNLGIEPARPKTFEEARAEVANAWQEQLDARLVARLKKKYRVRIHQDVLARAFANSRRPADGG